MRARIAIAILSFIPGMLCAHHSRSDYDTSEFVEMEGELAAIRWIKPHQVFEFLVAGPSGEIESWSLEGSGVYSLERSGITEDLFPVGEQVRIAGWRSRTRQRAFFLTHMLLPDGSELVLLPTANVGRRWSDDYSGGQWISEPAENQERSLFGVWSTESLDAFIQAGLGIEVQLTEEATAATVLATQTDPCVPPGMPSSMVNPLPVRLTDRGDHIEIHLEAFDVLRRVEMTERVDAATIPPSKYGYSTGTWDGDVLEVRTTRVNWPYFDDAGAPLTEAVEILERFSLDDDAARLNYTMTVRDPASFAEPVTLGWQWIDIGEQFLPHDLCQADSPRQSR